MSYGMQRIELIAMAERKLKDAQLLFMHNRSSSAYYLAGYAVEFGLKACIAKQIAHQTIPDKDFIKDLYTHDLTKLLRLAGLERQRAIDGKADQQFEAAWAITKDWTEQSRYETKLISDAQYLLEAISDTEHGVMQWIKRHW